MKIFITGGTGFIGSYTTQELKRRGHKLLLLSSDADHPKGFSYIKGNFSNTRTWGSKLKKFKPDIGIHLAWEGIPNFSYEQSMKNLKGGLAIFDVLAESGSKKIVAAGTGFECGSFVGKISEETFANPSTAFTAAKHSLRIMGEELAKEKGLEFIWLRPFNPYGHGQRAGSVIPYIISCVAKKTPLRLRNPLAQGDFIFIEDVARIIADSAEKGRGITTYNIGSGYLTPVRDIGKIICEEMKVGSDYLKDFSLSAKGRLHNAPYADLKKVHKEIGWVPKVKIREGIKKTVTSYKKNILK